MIFDFLFSFQFSFSIQLLIPSINDNRIMKMHLLNKI